MKLRGVTKENNLFDLHLDSVSDPALSGGTGTTLTVRLSEQSNQKLIL